MMKKIIEKIGIAAIVNIMAAVVALVMTIIGVYLVDEVFCYELEGAIVWAVGTYALVSAIRRTGDNIMAYTQTSKMIDNMYDMR